MHRPPTAALLLALATVLAPSPGRGQSIAEPCPLAVRASAARAEGRCLLRRLAALPETPAPVAAPSTVLPVLLRVAGRSSYAVDRNDGVLWGGRGFSGSATGGIAVRWHGLTLAIQPVLHAAENRGFELPDTAAAGLSRYAYPWAPAGLDWYQRPGSAPRIGLDPGDSFLEWTGKALAVGASTERLWWGPGRRYPLLFSGTSGGFPHLYARTIREIETPVGSLGSELFWGRLSESDWFDADPRNDARLLGAVQLRWSPAFVPGLSLWYSLTRHEPEPSRTYDLAPALDLFTGDEPESPPERRGLPGGVVGARLALTDLGLEVYAEVGRGEIFLNSAPGASDLHRSLVHMFGFTRTEPSEGGVGWRVAGELMVQALQLPQPEAARTADVVRTTPARQGHTHAGQLLGAYVGPGSNAQYLTIEWLTSARSMGLFGERVRRDDDAYYRLKFPNYGVRGHDVEWTVGLRGGGWLDLGALERMIGPFRVGFEAGASRRKNRSFIGLDGEEWRFRREWNVWGDLWLEWDPGLRSP